MADNTNPASFDVGNIPDIVKQTQAAAPGQVQDLIDTVTDATKKVQGANESFMNFLPVIQDRMAGAYAAQTEALQTKQSASWVPQKLRKLVGIFDSDFNDDFQNSKIQQAQVDLLKFGMQKEMAETARSAVIQSAEEEVKSKKEALDATKSGLDVAQSALVAHTALLQFQDYQDKFNLTRLGQPDLEAKAAAGDAMAKDELQRRKGRDLGISNLMLTNAVADLQLKQSQEANTLQHLTPEQLQSEMKNPSGKYNTEKLQEEQYRRTGQAASNTMAIDQAVTSQLHTRQLQLDSLASTTTSPEIASLAQKIQANNGILEVPTLFGGKAKLTMADAQYLLSKRTELDTAQAKVLGDASGFGTTIRSDGGSGDIIANNLTKIAPDPTILTEAKGAHDQINARIKVGDYKGAAEVATNYRKSMETKLDEYVTKNFDKTSQPMLRQFATTGVAGIGNKEASDYVVANVLSPNALRDSQYSSLAQPFADALTDKINKTSGLSKSGFMKGGKVDTDALLNMLQNGTFKSDEILREVLADPKYGLQKQFDAKNFSSYATATLAELAKLENPQQINPFGDVIDPQTGTISTEYLKVDPKTNKMTLDPQTLVDRLRRKSDELRKQGALRKDQDMADLFLQSLASPVRQKAFSDKLYSGATPADAALFRIFGGGNLEQPFASYVNNMRAQLVQKTDPAMRQETATAAAPPPTVIESADDAAKILSYGNADFYANLKTGKNKQIVVPNGQVPTAGGGHMDANAVVNILQQSGLYRGDQGK